MEILFRDLAKRPLAEILSTELLSRSCTEILPGDLLQRFCTKTLHRDVLQRSCREVSYIHLAKITLLESLHRRFHKEILNRDIA